MSFVQVRRRAFDDEDFVRDGANPLHVYADKHHDSGAGLKPLSDSSQYLPRPITFFSLFFLSHANRFAMAASNFDSGITAIALKASDGIGHNSPM